MEKREGKSKTLLNSRRRYQGLRGVKKQKFIIKEHSCHHKIKFFKSRRDYGIKFKKLPDFLYPFIFPKDYILGFINF